jgi:hypothetical protein
MMDRQAWIDEVQKIVCEFSQNDQDLGELMLDHSARYWDECFEDGLTPQQSLDKLVRRLSGTVA